MIAMVCIASTRPKEASPKKLKNKKACLRLEQGDDDDDDLDLGNCFTTYIG